MLVTPEVIKNAVDDKLKKLEDVINSKITVAAKTVNPPDALMINIDDNSLKLFEILMPRYIKAGWTKVETAGRNYYNDTTEVKFHYNIDFNLAEPVNVVQP